MVLHRKPPCSDFKGTVLFSVCPMGFPLSTSGSHHHVTPRPFCAKAWQLIIRIDLNQELGEPSSGKSVIIATTGGNVAVPGRKAVNVGLNVYRPQQVERTSRRLASRW